MRSVAPDRAEPYPLPLRCRVLLVTAAAAGVFAVVRYGELSPPALVAVLASGCVVAAVGLARLAGSAAAPVRRAGLPWLLWSLAVLGWEAVTLAYRSWLPPVSDLLDPVLANAAVRGAATAAWFAAGWWLVTRPSRSRGWCAASR